MQAERARSASGRADAQAPEQADVQAASPIREKAAEPTPMDSMAVADVSTGRRRDAGAAFRREMTARVDHAEGASADDYADADSLADGWPNEFQTPRGE